MVLAMALLLQLLVDPDLVSLRIVNNCIVRCESVYPPELGPEKTILFVPTSGGPNKFSQSAACITGRDGINNILWQNVPIVKAYVL